MLIFKQISPTRIKPDVFREEILNALRRTEKLIVKDYQRTTRTWTHSVKFESGIRFPQGSPGVFVETSDAIYGYVNLGTKPHMIFPKRAGGVLAFQGVYKAKTTPGVIDARGGGKSGDMVYTRGVSHPGTEARGFDEAIAKEWEHKFPDAMQDALDRGAKKCGHGWNT